jgi:hypothetical protein
VHAIAVHGKILIELVVEDPFILDISRLFGTFVAAQPA